MSSFGRSCCRLPHGVVVWPAGLSFRLPYFRSTPPYRPSAARGVVWPSVSPFCCSRYHVGRRVINQPFPAVVHVLNVGLGVSGRGEGHQGPSWGGEGVVVVVRGREEEPPSTIDAVDVQLKLRSHAK